MRRLLGWLEVRQVDGPDAGSSPIWTDEGEPIPPPPPPQPLVAPDP